MQNLGRSIARQANRVTTHVLGGTKPVEKRVRLRADTELEV
jgi:hypothetical protein